MSIRNWLRIVRRLRKQKVVADMGRDIRGVFAREFLIRSTSINWTKEIEEAMREAGFVKNEIGHWYQICRPGLVHWYQKPRKMKMGIWKRIWYEYGQWRMYCKERKIVRRLKKVMVENTDPDDVEARITIVYCFTVGDCIDWMGSYGYDCPSAMCEVVAAACGYSFDISARCPMHWDT